MCGCSSLKPVYGLVILLFIEFVNYLYSKVLWITKNRGNSRGCGWSGLFFLGAQCEEPETHSEKDEDAEANEARVNPRGVAREGHPEVLVNLAGVTHGKARAREAKGARNKQMPFDVLAVRINPIPQFGDDE